MRYALRDSGRRLYPLTLALVLLLVALAPVRARADVVDVVNHVRAEGCGRNPSIQTPLRLQRSLSAAAKRLARGDSFDQALLNAGYRARRSTSLSIGGKLDDESIASTLRTQFCAQVMDPGLLEIGVYSDGAALWMILSLPFVTPPPRDAAQISQRVLELTNRARAQGYRCGSQAFAPAQPLKPNAALEHAALTHSQDQASHSDLSHEGSDSSLPADRAARAGYRWRIIGENVAAGPVTAEEVLQGWLASPHHCSNIMDPRYSDMAVAFAIDHKSKSVIYWTQMFGAPQLAPQRPVK